MLCKILVSFLIAAVVLWLLWLLRGVMLTPVKPGEHEHISIVLTVDGAAPGLSQTVDALCWLRANGTLRAEIFVRNAGMDPETLAAAALLQKSGIIMIID